MCVFATSSGWWTSVCAGGQCARVYRCPYTCAAYINCTRDRECAHSNIHLLKSQIETSVDGLGDRSFASLCVLLNESAHARMQKHYQRLVWFEPIIGSPLHCRPIHSTDRAAVCVHWSCVFLSAFFLLHRFDGCLVFLCAVAKTYRGVWCMDKRTRDRSPYYSSRPLQLFRKFMHNTITAAANYVPLLTSIWEISTFRYDFFAL